MTEIVTNTVVTGDWDLPTIIEYVTYHAIDNEDFLDNSEVNQIRFLNISKRVLSSTYSGYNVPDQAVWLFACTLNSHYNDTMVMAQRGVASFGVEGISFTFKDWAKKELSELIPKDIRDMITATDEIGVTSGGFGSKWVVM